MSTRLTVNEVATTLFYRHLSKHFLILILKFSSHNFEPVIFFYSLKQILRKHLGLSPGPVVPMDKTQARDQAFLRLHLKGQMEIPTRSWKKNVQNQKEGHMYPCLENLFSNFKQHPLTHLRATGLGNTDRWYLWST